MTVTVKTVVLPKATCTVFCPEFALVSDKTLELKTSGTIKSVLGYVIPESRFLSASRLCIIRLETLYLHSPTRLCLGIQLSRSASRPLRSLRSLAVGDRYFIRFLPRQSLVGE